MEEGILALRAYAKQKVDENRDSILANLRKKVELPLVLDVGFPGAAYFSISAGGLAEVLHLLGDDVVQVDRFVGASGGACSLFLIVANLLTEPSETPSVGVRCPSSELLLRSYLQYGESEGSSTVSRGFNAMVQSVRGCSPFWERTYRALLQDERVFQSIRQRAFCAVAAKPIRTMMRSAAGAERAKQEVPKNGTSRDTADPSQAHAFRAASDNYIFHDYANREQAVQAFVATGEATLKGFMGGIDVIGAEESGSKADAGKAAPMTLLSCDEAGVSCSCALDLPPKFCDGGHPVDFGLLPSKVIPTKASSGAADKSRNAFLYFHTFYDNDQTDAALVSPESVQRLFQKGVDRAIACLTSESFASPQPDPRSTKSGKKLAADRMVIIMPDSAPEVELAKIGHEKTLAGGAFVSLRLGEVFELASS